MNVPHIPPPKRPSHAEIVRLLEENDKANEPLIMEYLKTISESYPLNEVFAVITLVDTPDVFG